MITRSFLYACLLAALLGGALAVPGRAQDRLASDPGYVDFALVERWFDAEATVEVNIRGALLRLVAGASEADDPDLARLLRRLRAIQVRAFPLHHVGFGTAERHIRGLAAQLEDRGWDTVVRVREPGERVDMYLKTDGDAIAGLVVLALDANDGESVFINIVGEIDPEEIGRIGRGLNLHPLDGFSNGSF